MTAPLTSIHPPVVRPLQYRDLEHLEHLWANTESALGWQEDWKLEQEWIYRWYWPLKALSWFPNPWQHRSCFLGAVRDMPVARISDHDCEVFKLGRRLILRRLLF